MTYAIAVQRPDTDAPPKTSYLQWYTWAKKNAPFTSATLKEWAQYIGTLKHPAISPQRIVMSTEGMLTPEQIRLLLSYPYQPPEKVLVVFRFAVHNDYPVSFTPTDVTLAQYLEKTSS